MPRYQRVVIVGVGLLGGSIGLALRRRQLAVHVVGVGRQAQSLIEAQALGAISEWSVDLTNACAGADLVIVCTPVQSIADYVQRSLACQLAAGGWVTDVGSTKASICNALAGPGQERFCGAHPMAGSDKSGVRHASADLFEQRLTIVTPTARTPDSLVDRAQQFWQSLGCRTLRMAPDQHDQAIARVSHLPHLIAAALSGATDPSLLPLVGSGWCDTTRIAAGSVELWQQIIAENQQPVLTALEDFSSRLADWLQAIRAGDQARLTGLLEEGKRNRDLASRHARPNEDSRT